MTKIFSTISIIFAIMMTLFVPADIDKVEVIAIYQADASLGEYIGGMSLAVRNNTGKFISDPELESIEEKVDNTWVDTGYELHTELGYRNDDDSVIVPPEAIGSDVGLICDGEKCVALPAGEYRLTISYTVFKLRSEKVTLIEELIVE